MDASEELSRLLATLEPSTPEQDLRVLRWKVRVVFCP
jgi:hypothetical protein